jgi:hypothetical protein
MLLCELEQLDAQRHNEHVLFGVVDVTEVEGFAKSGLVKGIKHFAQAKVVVDVKRDAL